MCRCDRELPRAGLKDRSVRASRLNGSKNCLHHQHLGTCASRIQYIVIAVNWELCLRKHPRTAVFPDTESRAPTSRAAAGKCGFLSRATFISTHSNAPLIQKRCIGIVAQRERYLAVRCVFHSSLLSRTCNVSRVQSVGPLALDMKCFFLFMLAKVFSFILLPQVSITLTTTGDNSSLLSY